MPSTSTHICNRSSITIKRILLYCTVIKTIYAYGTMVANHRSYTRGGVLVLKITHMNSDPRHIGEEPKEVAPRSEGTIANVHRYGHEEVRNDHGNDQEDVRHDQRVVSETPGWSWLGRERWK